MHAPARAAARTGLPLYPAGCSAPRCTARAGMVLYASSLCIRQGASYQAGFEVIRQLWIITIQFFECLNVATQALCATYLGKQEVRRAHGVHACMHSHTHFTVQVCSVVVGCVDCARMRSSGVLSRRLCK